MLPVGQTGSVNDLDPERFAVHRQRLSTGVDMAFVREGIGGAPLVLLHGWPETKRIWWRNIEPLVQAGYEVIVPDLRGFGDSSAAPDGFYDVAAFGADVVELVRTVLGHRSCTMAGGDLGGVVMYDLGLRHPGLVSRQCFFNSVPPALPSELFQAAGVGPLVVNPATSDYFVRQGLDGDGLAGELTSDAARRRYVEGFYTHRLWAAPGSFTPESAAFHAAPFSDAGRLRTSFGCYESALGTIPSSDRPRFREVNPVPTLVLVGPEDHVIPADFADRCAVAFPDAVGPLLVPRSGHFLQWERSELFNRSVAAFLGA